ncbi:putative mitochondrial 54S ribosomal protein YmL33 [Microthyrium microscopicum]|uniref:Large ribosomal subunit protein uL30m n=1 Tax=Microthyrium microscopicum TaxID=703497 RepID=A0A6A6UBG8_9PEZI|nr:putative mitochondrial 54S ribosomal protein YmL33 [Microthyrium microscopicum]
MSSPTWFRITLMRSAIGLPRRTLGILRALGLKKRMAVVYQPVSRDIAGMILKVKELVDVEEADSYMSKAQIKDSRRPDPGFYVEQRAPRPQPPATQ